MENKKYRGNLLKMQSVYKDPIQYTLPLVELAQKRMDEPDIHRGVSKELVEMNDLIGKNIRMVYEENINCVRCGRKTKKSFSQGFCYPCFRDAPENSPCIIHPELCEAHLGKGRDPEWEERNHNQPHIVYIALTSHIKVGVTRQTQIPYRWIDQGAWKAIVLAQTPNRYQAGLIEVELKQFASDKTSWQRMLKNELAKETKLIEAKELLQGKMDDRFNGYVTDNHEIYEINYPVLTYPTKIKAHSLDKEPVLEGKLIGIKAQYLIFEGGKVINIRKYAGYYINLEIL